MRSETDIIEACLHDLRAGEDRGTPLAEDVTWEGPPASGKLAGAEVRRLLSRFRPLVEEVRVRRHIVEGPYVASLLELATPAGTIPAFVCFRLANGLVKEIRTFYDPRGLGPGKDPTS